MVAAELASAAGWHIPEPARGAVSAAEFATPVAAVLSATHGDMGRSTCSSRALSRLNQHALEDVHVTNQMINAIQYRPD